MRIEMVGTAPLLMHNVRLADEQDPYTKGIKKLTAKKTNKTEEDQHEIARLKFAGGLYWDEEIGPYLPAENIFRCLMEAGSLTRSGKKIERAVMFDSDRAPLVYDGPRDIESLWNDGDSVFVDRRIVNGTPGQAKKTKIPGIRPIFPNWAASIGVEIDGQVIDPDEFQDIVEKAGKLIGIGDYRRFYGKFAGKVLD